MLTNVQIGIASFPFLMQRSFQFPVFIVTLDDDIESVRNSELKVALNGI